MRNTYTIGTLITLMVINTANSWSTYGHLVTASVAHCILE